MSLSQSRSHLYTGSQSLLYQARLEDQATNITCTVIQLDHLERTIYSSTISLQLEVAELVIYSQGSGIIEERIGIISGIILAIIFIILLLILIALFLTRRKKDPQYTIVNDKTKDEMLEPIWRPKRKTKVRKLKY